MGKIYVVEDLEKWQRELKTMLEEVGHEVAVFSDKQGALEGFALEMPDVAVIDMSLVPYDGTNREGWEVMTSTTVPVVVVSGYLSPSEVEKLHVGGASRWYFDKGAFNEDEFLQAVEEAIEIGKQERKRRWHEIESRLRGGD